MKASIPSQSRGASHAERVRIRLLRERHRRLARSIGLLLLVSAAMIILALINRDHQAMSRSARFAHQIAGAFQEQLEKTGRPPSRIPSVDPQTDQAVRERFLFNLFYTTQIDTARVVGVCGPKNPLRLYLRRTGRHIVLFENGRFRVRWIPEAEFKRRARSLGLEALIRD